MAWSVSAIFQQAMLNPIARGIQATTGFPTSYSATGLLGDTVNVALFNNSAAPDKTAAVGSTAYNTGGWSNANEVTSTNWAAGGRALASKTCTIDSGSSSLVFGAADLSGGGVVTLTGFYGCLVYDNTISGGTVAAQGMCFNYFGGTQTVTAGTFTIIWATVGAIVPPNGGVFNITV
jgi:hypothetical protein